MKDFKDICESVFDDDFEAQMDKNLIINWFLEVGWKKESINSFLRIAKDGTVSLVNPTMQNYMYLNIGEDKPFPGKWGDITKAKIELRIDGDVDWSKLNLPESVNELKIYQREGKKIDLTGLTNANGSIKIVITGRINPSIKLDPKLTTAHFVLEDGVWGNEKLKNINLSIPKGVEEVTIPKVIATAIVEKQLKKKVYING